MTMYILFSGKNPLAHGWLEICHCGTMVCEEKVLEKTILGLARGVPALTR